MYLLGIYQASFADLPNDFVYLKNVDPTILQDIRYCSNHNFVGRSIHGYYKPECILTTQAAQALKNVQSELRKKGLTLKVYDCYRPRMAVQDFMEWSRSTNHTMKNEFYPRENKNELFKKGYIAERSGHSRGSTVDLTIVDLTHTKQAYYHPDKKLVPCYAPWAKRYHDNSIDMGSGYDCLDPVANINNTEISKMAFKNRLFLKKLMIQNGFEPYEKEWWHFTLRREPFRNQYFNFPVAR